MVYFDQHIKSEINQLNHKISSLETSVDHTATQSQLPDYNVSAEEIERLENSQLALVSRILELELTLENIQKANQIDPPPDPGSKNPELSAVDEATQEMITDQENTEMLAQLMASIENVFVTEDQGSGWAIDTESLVMESLSSEILDNQLAPMGFPGYGLHVLCLDVLDGQKRPPEKARTREGELGGRAVPVWIRAFGRRANAPTAAAAAATPISGGGGGRSGDSG